jgi:serine/threonine protein kinase
LLLYEAAFLTVKQTFARKVLLIGHLQMAVVQNEVRSVEKLCAAGTNENIVAVLRHGMLPQHVGYYFDMELCAMNLEAYSKRLWEPTSVEKTHSDLGGPVIVDWGYRMKDIWVIMGQIASGVQFIHDQKEIHRDLKPQNSKTSMKNLLT